MQAIEFEATTFQHTIRVPDDIPDGAVVRVVLSFEDKNAEILNSVQTEKCSLYPSKLKLSRDEQNDRRPEYLTLTVNEIEMPTRPLK